MVKIFITAACVTLLGCTQYSSSIPQIFERYYQYQCDDEKLFAADFSQPGVAYLRFNGQYFELTQVQAGSGVRYILNQNASKDIDINLHTKGSKALLEVDGTVLSNCVTEDMD